MTVFSLDFMELPPDNFLFPAIQEELIASEVDDAVDYIRKRYGNELTKYQMEQVFAEFDINYPILPKYLQDKFDQFEIIG